MIALLLACSAEITVDPAACDAEALAAGQVRARRIPCSDELIDGGEGRRSDYLIENAVARFVIRQGSDALTRLGLAGGVHHGGGPGHAHRGSADALVHRS